MKYVTIDEFVSLILDTADDNGTLFGDYILRNGERLREIPEFVEAIKERAKHFAVKPNVTD